MDLGLVISNDGYKFREREIASLSHYFPRLPSADQGQHHIASDDGLPHDIIGRVQLVWLKAPRFCLEIPKRFAQSCQGSRQTC